MAKKNSKPKKNKEAVVEVPDNVLPQNIVPIGERVTEDKKIYISQKVYKEIHRFAKDKTTIETGGILYGNVIEEFGKTNIIIREFIEAKYSEGTPTTLTFTHESWEYVYKEAEKKCADYEIIGWIHTHPNFGIFLSEYDKFIQENFFKEENQIAYVVDPIQNIEGFYYRINGNTEKCKGFYVFDRTGEKITVGQEDEEKEEPETKQKNSLSTNLLLGAMLVAIVAFAVLCCSQMSKIKAQQQTINTLQEEVASVEAAIDANNSTIVGYISQIDSRLKALEPETTTEETTTEEHTDYVPETTTELPTETTAESTTVVVDEVTTQ